MSDDRSTVKWSSRVEHVLLSVVVSDGGEATAALSARMRAGARKQSAACYLIWQHLPDSHAGQQKKDTGCKKLQTIRVNRLWKPCRRPHRRTAAWLGGQGEIDVQSRPQTHLAGVK